MEKSSKKIKKTAFRQITVQKNVTHGSILSPLTQYANKGKGSAFRLKIFALSAALAFAACENVSEDSVPVNASAREISAAVSEIEPETVTVTDSEISASSETTEEQQETESQSSRAEHGNSEWDREFMENVVFAGDSICRALYVYNDLLTTKQVAAAGNCASWCVYDYTFKMEEHEFDLRQAAAYYKPSVIFLWMGMNDINMVEKDVYTENMKNIAMDMLEQSPESKIVVLSISPTIRGHKWDANERIREYNGALREMCENSEETDLCYVDIYDVLSDDEGYLLEEFDGGDGMHLSQAAYIEILCRITDVKDEFMQISD